MTCRVVSDEKPNAVVASLKQVFKWRSSTWWHFLHTRMMKEDPATTPDVSMSGDGTILETWWDKIPTCWAE